MSVTFFCPEAPTETFVPYEDEPDYTETRPVAPFTEVNMANSNAIAILAVVMPSAVYYGGTWEGGVLDTAIKNTTLALNRNPESLTTPDVHDGNFHMFGRDMDYVTRRLTELLHLFVTAKQHGLRVCYG